MAVALSARVATTRQHQPQTIAQHLRRLRDDVATPPDGYGADAPSDREDGESEAQLHRPGLDRRRARAAMAACACVLLTAPDRCARHDGPQRLLGDARTPRGWRVAWVERPRSDAPPEPLLRPMRSAVAESARPWRAERRRRGRQAARWATLAGGARPLALCAILSGPGSRVEAGVLPCQPPSWSPWLPGIPTRNSPSASTQSPHVCVMSRGPRLREDNAGMSPRCAASCGRPRLQGGASSGRSRPVPARRRPSALQPVGAGPSQQPTPREAWLAMPGPAIMSHTTFDATPRRRERPGQRARRHQTAHES
jgi:site-specific DNA recombinase